MEFRNKKQKINKTDIEKDIDVLSDIWAMDGSIDGPQNTNWAEISPENRQKLLLNDLDVLERETIIRLKWHTSAGRIGSRIRTIRSDKLISRDELGKDVGLSVDRIQKYENGIRSPRPELLENIASALGVDVVALEEPSFFSDMSVLYTLFEFEKYCHLELEEHDGNICFRFDSNFHPELCEAIKEWYQRQRELFESLHKPIGNMGLDYDTYPNYLNWKHDYGITNSAKIPNNHDVKAFLEETLQNIHAARTALLEDPLADLSPFCFEEKNMLSYYTNYHLV